MTNLPPPPPGGTPAPPPPYPAAQPGPPPSDGRRRGLVVAVVALAGLAVLAIAAVAFLLLRSDPAMEVRLEPVAATTPDGFTASVARTERPLSSNLIATAEARDALPPQQLTGSASAPRTGAPPASRSVSGSVPGLYGGTRDDGSCDPDALVAFLEQTPEKATAWAGVFAIAPGDIADFVDGLTPVTLTRDTRVTNHGFRDGAANRIQSVLQAGTAVLVDDRGVPRVKCGCGNPLAGPATPDSGTEVAYAGDGWPGVDPVNFVDVTVEVAVEQFVLVDLDGGQPFERPVGTTGDDDGSGSDDPVEVPEDPIDDDRGDERPPTGPSDVFEEPELGTGDLQVTLRWAADVDLDLSVTDPAGDTVSFVTDSVPSGGSLDVDSIPCGDPSQPAVENVFWPTGSAPTGVYVVRVDYFGACGGSGPAAFELEVLVGGEVVLDESGTLGAVGDSLEWDVTVESG